MITLENTNSISLYETVTDRNNKKHKIYSVRFKDMQIVTSFTSKYTPIGFIQYLMAPVLDEDGMPELLPDGTVNMNNGFEDDLMEIIECALDYRESREQIMEWLDMKLAEEIVQTFLGISQFKKKVM